MWGCEYQPFAGGGWWGTIFHGGLIFVLVLILIIAVAIYVAIRISSSRSRNSGTPSQDRIDSMQILKARFAKGEISPEEFAKMKQIIS